MNLLAVITTFISLLISPIYSYSACDDVDIHFMIDSDSIINNGDNVEHFIKSVVWNGTSEYSAVSIALYGDNIPSASEVMVIHLHETHKIYHRGHQERAIISKLKSAFKSIKSSITASNGRIVTISDAFSHSNKQSKPQRLSKKDSILSSINHESIKTDEYFIFDYNNKLLSNSPNNDELCSLLYHDRVVNKNMHFMMGQSYNSIHIQCTNGNVYEDRIDHTTFFYFDAVLNDNKKMEIIYDITCPADHGDKLSLGNHNQWIDPDVINKCELVELHPGNNTAPLQLDYTKSFIEVRDYTNDGNTFKKNDYLIGHTEIQMTLSDLGCWSMVYKITDVKVIDDTNTDFKVLRLSVSIPASPTEYILRANVADKVPLFTTTNNPNNPTTRRRMEDSITAYATGAIITAELLTNLFASKYQYYKAADEAIYTAGSSPQFVFTGSAEINMSLEYDFNVDVDLDFDFSWDTISGDTYFYYTLDANYSFSKKFNLDFSGSLEIAINDLIKYGRYYFIWLGPIPVVIKPFIEMSAKLTTLPIEVDASLTCKYGELLQTGYEYDLEHKWVVGYGVIKTDAKYSFITGAVKTWTDISTADDCAQLNYDYGTGYGATCKWFDYNPSAKRCRCYGNTPTLAGATETESGTTAYIMSKTCNDIYTKECSYTLCDLDIQVDNGDACSGLKTGSRNYDCISCPNDAGYENITIKEQSIKIRTPNADNGCTYDYYISANGQDLSQCPTRNKTDLFGFDVEVDTKIGAVLYSIVTVYGKPFLYIPFRINVPEFDDTICANTGDSCTDSQAMQASFSIAMNMVFSIGVSVDFTELTNTILGLINGGEPQNITGLDFYGTEIEIGTYQILPTTSLGCLPFTDALSFLDTYYKGICCVAGEPVYIDLDNNGYDDRYEPTTTPAGGYGGGSDGYMIGSSVVVWIIGIFIGFMGY